MNFFEFNGISISGITVAVPDHYDELSKYASYFPEGEVEKFCRTTGIRSKYVSSGVGTTTSDLCVAATEKLIAELDVDRSTIDGLIFLTQTPDYCMPPTSCVIQYRLGLRECGLVYDSTIGCTAFPFGIQMACADIAAGCKRILLLMGDSAPERAAITNKDGLLFGDAGCAVLIEKDSGAKSPIHICIDTIGEGYKSLIAPYGMYRHSIWKLVQDRGPEQALPYFHLSIMQGSDVFTFSIKDAPKAVKAFYERFNCTAEDFDLITIHQANKMIVENVAKRIKAPMDKVPMSLSNFGNTGGASPAVNLCDYFEHNPGTESRKILAVSFGIGLNIAIASFDIDASKCFPIFKTSECFDDGIDNYTYF